jgi:hypothetical protein
MIEPLGHIIQVEKHLVTDSDHWQIVLLRPKLNSSNMQSHIFGKGSQPNKSFACDLNDVFFCHVYTTSAIPLLLFRAIFADHQDLHTRAEIFCRDFMKGGRRAL